MAKDQNDLLLQSKAKASQEIHDEESGELEFTVEGYKKRFNTRLLEVLYTIISLGFIQFMFYSRPHFRLLLTYHKCSLDEAEVLLIRDNYGRRYSSLIEHWHPEEFSTSQPKNSQSGDASINISPALLSAQFSTETNSSQGEVQSGTKNTQAAFHSELRYFVHHQSKFIWEQEKSTFIRLIPEQLRLPTPCSQFYHQLHSSLGTERGGATGALGLVIEKPRPPALDDRKARAAKLAFYGPNVIRVHVTPVFKLVVNEVFTFYYLFPLGACVTWCLLDYYVFSILLVIISTSSLCLNTYLTRRNLRELKEKLDPDTKVRVVRPNPTVAGSVESVSVSSEELVPGDVLDLEQSFGTARQLSADSGVSVVSDVSAESETEKEKKKSRKKKKKTGLLEWKIPCDAVLLSGTCIVNESILTGESVPVAKVALPDSRDEIFDAKAHSRHLLFCGTNLIQSRAALDGPPRALVLRTGYMTAKGELIKSILYPAPIDYKFKRHSYYFLIVMAVIGTCFMIYDYYKFFNWPRLPFLYQLLLPVSTLFTVVPPSLPMAMLFGIFWANFRLRRYHRIYCTNPKNIITCGSVNCVCFDKTGTLTEDGLDVMGIVPSQIREFQSLHSPDEFHKLSRLIQITIATCHSLSNLNGQFIGDPLDQKMFEASNWNLKEVVNETGNEALMASPPDDDEQQVTALSGSGAAENRSVEVLKQFPFTSALQRMSVLVRDGPVIYSLVKGSPEAIFARCTIASLPFNFKEKLEDYTLKGLRVIALAYKEMPPMAATYNNIERELLEERIRFLGLLLFENRLKPESAGVIQCLRNANIRTLMVTGDNLLTSITIARECHILTANKKHIIVEVEQPPMPHDRGAEDDAPTEKTRFRFRLLPPSSSSTSGPAPPPLNDAPAVSLEVPDLSTEAEADTILEDYQMALAGPTFEALQRHRPDIFQLVLRRGGVFARMLPDQKKQLVESIQKFGLCAAMCGDGSNDCGAMRAAQAGIAIASGEASVAAPFTSPITNVSAVPNMIREGRAALVTSFNVFKYMILYSSTQTIAINLLFWQNFTYLSDYQYLYQDLYEMATLSITFGMAWASGTLSNRVPTVSLLSWRPISSVLVNIVMMLAFQVFMLSLMHSESWYIPPSVLVTDIFVPSSFDNSLLFIVSSYQLAIFAISFSEGHPHRRPFYTNWIFTLILVAAILITTYFLFLPTHFFLKILTFKEIPTMGFKAVVFLMCLAFGQLIYISEHFVMNSEWLEQLIAYCVSVWRRRNASDTIAAEKAAASELLDALRTPVATIANA